MVGLFDLPKVLIKHIASFFDLDSLLKFSSTNKIYRTVFSDKRELFCFLNQSGFIRNSKEELKAKKEKLRKIIVSEELEFSSLVDTLRFTPLHYACESEKMQIEMIKLIVEKKSDLNCFNSFQNSPLIYLSRNNEFTLETFRYLIEKKCDLNLLNNQGDSPLLTACFNPKISPEILKYLVENKSDLNLKNEQQNTCLMNSCKSENISLEIIQFLVENKSDLNCSNRRGFTALHNAVLNKNTSVEIIQFLLNINCLVINGRIILIFVRKSCLIYLLNTDKVLGAEQAVATAT